MTDDAPTAILTNPPLKIVTETAPEAAPEAAPAHSGEEPRASPFARRVMRIAAHLDRMRNVTGLRGQLAILRRIAMDPAGIPPETYWELMQKFEVPFGEEPFWLRVLPLMASRRHDPRQPPGVALEKTEVTPARLERWLRAEQEDAWAQAPRILARLGDAGIDWVSLAYLLRDWNSDQRTALAQEFFRARHRRTSTKGA